MILTRCDITKSNTGDVKMTKNMRIKFQPTEEDHKLIKEIAADVGKTLFAKTKDINIISAVMFLSVRTFEKMSEMDFIKSYLMTRYDSNDNG
jgi:hypothetical protein